MVEEVSAAILFFHFLSSSCPKALVRQLHENQQREEDTVTQSQLPGGDESVVGDGEAKRESRGGEGW